MAKTLPGKVIRGTSRAGIGGGAILIALALFFLFRGFGPGGTGATGSGTGSESTPGGSAMITTGANDSSATTTSLAAPDRISGGLTEDEKKALSGDTLTVLIDEHDYLIELPGSPDPIFRPTPLKRIVELAALSKGDTNGIRVRILRRQSSRTSAEEQLKLELEKNGIHKDSVVMPSELMP